MFDPVLNSMLKRTEVESKHFKQRILCYHCYRRIEGKILYYDDKPFDEFCFQFRYVLFTRDKDEEYKRKLLEETLEKKRSEIESSEM
ncbi:MAG: hypothetical protein JSV49_08810 [Thermoplasmata archaeon]|nr:MAG: hypothetical protein JSV49_08810 [Thermoplasmata archaeon]